jgi:hypothetical protein
MAIEKLKIPKTLYKVKLVVNSKATLSPFKIEINRTSKLENLFLSKLVHKLSYSPYISEVNGTNIYAIPF